MPNHYTHLFLGISSAFLLYLILQKALDLNTDLILIIFFVSTISAVFPDIDHRNSKVHRSVKSFIILLFVIYLGIMLYPGPEIFLLPFLAVALYFLFSFVKPRHRGITHSLGFCTLFAFFVGLFSYFFFGSSIPAFFSFVSYLSHLIADRFWKN
jgi:inner membrane protein